MFACLAVLVLAAGCQQRRATVDGAVTVDGKPLSIASDARGTVVFHPSGGEGTTLTGLLDAGGKFRLATGASSEIAPGKYQVAVSIVRLLPKSDEAEQGAERITPVHYASPEESGLEANVVAGENHLRFNLESEAANEEANETESASSPTPPNSATSL
jgi:hypothetical protein